jgi:hypothetical protein
MSERRSDWRPEFARRVWLVFLAGTVVACARAPAATPAQVPRVYVPPFAEPVVRQWAEDYVTETGGALPFDLDPRTLDSALSRVPLEPNSLLLFDGPPPQDWFVTSLASIPVVILVHPDNQVLDLRPEDLQNLFARRTAVWSNVGGREVDVQPVLPLVGEPLRSWFESVVMRGTPVWPGTWLAPTPEAMASLVSSEPGAVGIFLGSEVPSTVAVVRVLAITPSEERYPYRLDLLAFAPQEPAGGVRDWLGWVQARLAAR